MIYITGDTHGHIDLAKLYDENFPQQKDLTKDDYLIICGDFGLVWDNSPHERYLRDKLSNRHFTTLWIDGNHENFDLLETFPEVDMFGGKCHQIEPAIYHLKRGQVLTIDGHTFFVMGGATSIDKSDRKEHISWWEQELPTTEEMNSAIDALDSHNWEVDYVLTHCAPKSILPMVAKWWMKCDSMNSFLERVRMDLEFKRWFFGHYHVDKQINEQFTALYNWIVPVQKL